MSSAQATRKMGSLKAQKRFGMAWRLAVAFLAIVFSLFPVVLIFSTSINPVSEVTVTKLIPDNATLNNYRRMLGDPQFPFPLWVWNSIKVSGITSLLVVALTSLAAFSFSRFRFRLRQPLLRTVLLVQVFPNILAVTALFLILLNLGRIYPQLGLNTHAGLILVYLGGAMGFNTWLMKGFFDTIPRELDEAAYIDGASSWYTFTRVIFPLVRPILAVIFILTFIGTYGDYLLARVLLTDKSQYTVAVGLSLFIGEQYSQRWNLFAAGALMAALPTLILFYLIQNQLQSGLTVGAVKG
ncbi:MAG: sugar ABC transporter permease [Caldilineales bacterium]|nr:sugar ABC transporter permease [Caldilineales bacterium]MDW8317737.1 sugar ABC transporter permease [Anaerolineae bacterium]